MPNKIILYILLSILFSNCGKVKINNSDLDETVLIGNKQKDLFKVKCDFSTYVVYQDSLPLYDNAKGKIVKYHRFEENPEYDFGGGFLFKNSKLGWLQIGADKINPTLENYWIKSNYVFVGTNNYNKEHVSLFKQPNVDSEVVGTLKVESDVNVLNCYKEWVFVEKNGDRGWLPPEFICTNPETNCN